LAEGTYNFTSLESPQEEEPLRQIHDVEDEAQDLTTLWFMRYQMKMTIQPLRGKQVRLRLLKEVRTRYFVTRQRK